MVVDSSTVELGESTLYRYRFRQIEPASDRFTFQDRDLSFYFRPAPDALHFQIENRQDHPVWIEWERCQFWDVDGLVHRVAHRDTRWENRLSTMPPVPIAGLERYSDYVVPIELLLDPGPSAEQVRRPLFPDDSSAPQYIDRSFGVDLAFRIEDKLRGYTFRFKVASVVPP